MITGLKKVELPSAYLTLPHYVISGLCLLFVLIVSAFSNTDLLGHFFQPKILALTHLTVLGFITMVIFGSVYQMLPVVLECKLFSEKLGTLTFVLLITGTSFLSYGFWTFHLGFVFFLGGAMVLTSFLCFSFNFYKSIKSKQEWQLEADIISTSIIWLLLTGTVGLILAINLRFAFIPKDHLEVLKIHAHLGFLGWIFMLIQGVGSRFIPMFLLVTDTKQKLLRASFLLVNAGLISYIIFYYFSWDQTFKNIAIIILASGIILFLFFILDIFRRSSRKILDPGLKLTRLSFVFLISALITGIIITIAQNQIINLGLLYGILILVAGAGTLILGQSMKIVPFLVWIHKYSHQPGRQKLPLAKDLISEKINVISMYLYIFGNTLLIIGIILKSSYLMLPGILILICAVILFLYNIIKTILHLAK